MAECNIGHAEGNASEGVGAYDAYMELGKIACGSKPGVVKRRKGLGAHTLRILAWVLVVFGVAILATWGAYFLMGLAIGEKLVSTGVVGGIVVAAGYWLERNTRPKPPDQQSDAKTTDSATTTGPVASDAPPVACTCPQCGAPLPPVRDGFCPECRTEFPKTSEAS